jgi:hypothetical protein
MATFLGQPVRRISRLVISFYGDLWRAECTRHVRQTYRIPNKEFQKTAVSYHLSCSLMESLRDPVQQCFSLDWHLTGAVFLCNICPVFVFQFTLLWINFNILASTGVFFINSECTTPHSVYLKPTASLRYTVFQLFCSYSLMVHEILFAMLNVAYFSISTSCNPYAVSSVAVFASSLLWCFPVICSVIFWTILCGFCCAYY